MLSNVLLSSSHNVVVSSTFTVVLPFWPNVFFLHQFYQLLSGRFCFWIEFSIINQVAWNVFVTRSFYDIYSGYGKFCFVLSDPLFQWKQNIFKQGYESVYSVLIEAVTLFVNFCCIFLGFVLFPGTCTWWLFFFSFYRFHSVWYNL